MLDMSSCSAYVMAAIPTVAAPSGLYTHVYASADMSPYAHHWLVPWGHAPVVCLSLLAPYPDRTVLLVVGTGDNAVLVYDMLAQVMTKESAALKMPPTKNLQK